MKTLLSTALLALSLTGGASAATLNPLDLKNQDWVVIDLSKDRSPFQITPTKTDGSFSYSLAFSNSLCPQPWACTPSGYQPGTVQSGGNSGFGYSWEHISGGSVGASLTIDPRADSLYMYFRVTSGNGTLSQLASSLPSVPSPVPLPATALLLAAGLGGLGGLAALRRRRKAA